MKKIVIFLLCITLIFSLVSCDVSSFWSGILGTTTTTQPNYEKIKLKSLIDVNDIEYIELYYHQLLDSSLFGRGLLKIENTNEFYDNYLAKLSDHQLIGNDAQDLYREKTQELDDYTNPPHDNYLEQYSLTMQINYKSINIYGYISLYHNGMITVSIPDADTGKYIYYISSDYYEISLSEMVDEIYAKYGGEK